MTALDVWDGTGKIIYLKTTATWEDIYTALMEMDADRDTYMARHRRPERIHRMRTNYRAKRR